MENRKIVQISSVIKGDEESGYSTILFALCDDGTIWEKYGDEWDQVDHKIPQIESEY